MTPEKLREYRKKLKAKGICTRCHKNKAVDGKVLCTTCYEITNKHRDRIRALEYRCNNCLNKMEKKRGRCDRCLELHKKCNRTLCHKRRAAGLCIVCGKPSESYYLCVNCAERVNQRKALARSL